MRVRESTSFIHRKSKLTVGVLHFLMHINLLAEDYGCQQQEGDSFVKNGRTSSACCRVCADTTPQTVLAPVYARVNRAMLQANVWAGGYGPQMHAWQRLIRNDQAARRELGKICNTLLPVAFSVFTLSTRPSPRTPLPALLP